jgi:hypothetical protein
LGINKKNAEKLHLREALYNIIGIEEIFVTCNLHTEANRMLFSRFQRKCINFGETLQIFWGFHGLWLSCMRIACNNNNYETLQIQKSWDFRHQRH